MIHESGGVTNQVHNERVYRENHVTPDRAAAEKEIDHPHSGVFDKISLSAEALTLAKSGAPVSEGSELGQGEELGRRKGEEQPGEARMLDIRV